MAQGVSQVELTDKWTKLILDYQSSPLTVKEFTRQNQIATSSLYSWAERLDLPLKNLPPDGIEFIELTACSSSSVPVSKFFVVEISTVRLKIKTEVPWTNIVELVRELA